MNTATDTAGTPRTPGTMLLTRTRDGRMLAGVCGGIARYTGVDVTLVRLAFVIATLCGLAGVVGYVAAWVLLPEEA